MSHIQPSKIAKFKSRMKKPIQRMPRSMLIKESSIYMSVRYSIPGPDYYIVAQLPHPDHRQFVLRK